MQGPTTSRVLLLWLTCLWLVGCGTTSELATQTTPTPIYVEVPVEVTRLVTQHVTEQIVTAATPAPATPCASTQPGENAIVTIGAILPLSSPGAFLAGYAMQTALNLAVSDINTEGGINGVQLRLITYDSAGTPERSALFAERLIVLDCAVAIVGLFHNNDALAVSDVAHRFGVPTIVVEAGADDITARGYAEIFRLSPAYSMLAQQPALWLREVGDFNNDGKISAAIVADNSAHSTPYVQAMRDALHASEMDVALFRVELPSSDFSSTVARLVALEQLPDAVFIVLKGASALNFQAQLLEAGIGPQRSSLIVQHHVGLDSAQFWKIVPNGTGTVVMRRGAWPGTLTEFGEEFAAKYEQYMGRWPESYAFASYDAVRLVADALANASLWDGPTLITTLEETTVSLTAGPISFGASSVNPLRAGQPAYLWHQAQSDQLLYLQYTEINQPATEMPIIWPPNFRAPSLSTAFVSIAP